MSLTAEKPPTTAMPAVPAPRDRDSRWELAAALRTFGALRYEFGFNGHVSARASEAPGHFWVNPFGVSISAVNPSDFVLVNGDGEIVDTRGNYSINGFAGNLALHQAVPEANAVIHLHSPAGFVWSSFGKPLEPVNTDSALVVGLQGLSTKTWGDADAPSNADLAVRGHRVILQQGHGFTTWGSTVGEAAFYLHAAERAAESNLALRGFADRNVLDEAVVTRWTLSPELARAHFEPSFTVQEAQGLH
jgi:ribulose-5-phosphate 4-epimerase/fuculose-1-phosphate aldolase